MQIKNILTSIIPQSEEEERVLEIDIGSIIPNRYQPRKYFDENKIDKLAKSISQAGMLQPLLVRRLEEGYELICGERRLRAAKIAGLEKVPCIVKELSDSKTAAAALAENLQRSELNCFEQAEGFRQLIGSFGYTQQQIAVMLGISQPAVANKLRLLNLREEIRERIIASGLTERHARALLKAGEPQRSIALEAAINQKYTAEALEKFISDLTEQDRRRRSYKKRAAALGDVRLFINTVEKAVKVMKLAGVNAETQKKSDSDYIEYTIRIPKTK